jgi:transposase
MSKSEAMKQFREYEPGQGDLFPPSPMDWLPDGHLVHFILDVVEALDLTPFYEVYSEGPGQRAYSPKMMLAVWIYAYALGIRSSRRVEKALYEDVGFRVVSGNQQPNFWTLNKFRTTHRKALSRVLSQTVRIARETGLLKFGKVAIDGTKLKANASKHSAMSYKRMEEEEKRLRTEIRDYLNGADQTDAEENRRLGKERGDELPEGVRTQKARLQKILEAKQRLEEQAKERARAEQDERREQAESEGREYKPRTNPDDAEPEPKAQSNFTDPESRIMLGGDKAFIQGYNGQLAVDAESQMIVAADLSNSAADPQHLPGLMEQAIDNYGATPKCVLADAGYYSQSNLDYLEQHDIEALIPPGKVPHSEWRNQKAPKGRIPKTLSAKDRMRRKLSTKRGRAVYKLRQTSVEPVIGQIKQARGLRQFLHRGEDLVRDMWRFECAVHNILKLFKAEICFG